MIELKRRIKFAGDIFNSLVNDAGWDIDTAASFLNKIPDEEVQDPKHGEWETCSDRPDRLICSVCNCGFDMWKHDRHNYCPSCGAKMGGEDMKIIEIEKAVETIKQVSDLDVQLHLNISQYDLLTAIEALKEKAEREKVGG